METTSTICFEYRQITAGLISDLTDKVAAKGESVRVVALASHRNKVFMDIFGNRPLSK